MRFSTEKVLTHQKLESSKTSLKMEVQIGSLLGNESDCNLQLRCHWNKSYVIAALDT